jgi:protein-S-isoprenylcysteine O-methyltransferase Ste14
MLKRIGFFAYGCLSYLIFSVATTAYILLAIQFEERDLAREHGEAYEEYRRSVPMLVPFARRRLRKALAGVGREA